MRYCELNHIWKRIFELEWESLCNKSKAIAAIIADTNDQIISEGRNKVGEGEIPNPKVSHAEVEAIRNLDVQKYPWVKSYTLYAALEPCPMCMGTLVMGGIRNVVIGVHDDLGGAMELIEKSRFIKSKNISVTWMPQIYGDIQRGLQTIKELLYSDNLMKQGRVLADFSVYNAKGVAAAKALIDEGLFTTNAPEMYKVEYIFNRLAELIED